MQSIQRQLDGVTVLELNGTLHCGDGDREFESTIDNLVSGGSTRLLINLRGVTHIDSMCLGVFITAYVKCQRRGGTVLLLQTPPRIQQLLAITRLDQFLPTFATEEEAIRHLPLPTSAASARTRERASGVPR